MKITKSRLKQIIKEELEAALLERDFPGMDDAFGEMDRNIAKSEEEERRRRAAARKAANDNRRARPAPTGLEGPAANDNRRARPAPTGLEGPAANDNRISPKANRKKMDPKTHAKHLKRMIAKTEKKLQDPRVLGGGMKSSYKRRLAQLKAELEKVQGAK